jgi:hypothetical protein
MQRYFLASLALHCALVGLASIRSCSRDPPPVAPTLRGDLVTIEVAALAPVLRERTTGAAAKPKRPGGGGAVRRPKLALASAELPPEEPLGREAAVVAPVDVDATAAPSPVVIAARPVGAGPFGSGPGTHGGPGGPGAGAGSGGPPLVNGAFAFGRDTRGRFKGVACFIPPGTLRIADVAACEPMAVFYTNTFNVPERHQGEGFPGISGRSSWFMIEYNGVFTVARDGSYKFRLHSDDGSYLFVDGAQVIENDGKHQPTSRSGTILLRTGEHQLKLLYAQTTDRMALQLFVRVPGVHGEKLFTPRI